MWPQRRTWPRRLIATRRGVGSRHQVRPPGGTSASGTNCCRRRPGGSAGCGSGWRPEGSGGQFLGEVGAEEPGYVRDGVVDLRRRVVVVVVVPVGPHEFLLTLEPRVELLGLLREGALV